MLNTSEVYHMRHTVRRTCSYTFCSFFQNHVVVGTEEKSNQNKNNQQHKQAACTTTSTERCAHRTAHSSSSEDSRSLYTAVYFSVFRRMRLTHSAVASKANVNIWNLNEVTTPARKNCFQDSLCPVKRRNRAGSPRNEPDYYHGRLYANNQI